MAESELDQDGFDVKEWTKKVLKEQDLAELLKTYNGILTGKGASTQPPLTGGHECASARANWR